MTSFRLSTFPLHKPFECQGADTPLSEFGLRLVADFYTDQPRMLGSAIVIAGYLVSTARHVLSDLIVDPNRPDKLVFGDHHLVAVQILPGPEYIFWDVDSVLFDLGTDLALLHLGPNPGRSHPEKPVVWAQPRINPFAPAIGERVAAFGYRKSNIDISPNDRGGNHIQINDEPMVSVGVVREIHEFRRDSMLPFPCYQVSARFDAGMSGGPVFEETGALCGIVCSNVEGSHLDGEPVSYVSSLWPLFRLSMNFNRGDGWPRDVPYYGIELARAGLVVVPELHRLNQFFAENITLPPSSIASEESNG
jgi:hypothetical protein